MIDVLQRISVFGPPASDLWSRREDERQLTEPVSALCLLRPDGMGTVSVEEKENFEAIRSRLMALLENQITHFRYEHLIASLQRSGESQWVSLLYDVGIQTHLSLY